MKKILALLLAAVLVLSCAACGSKPAESTPTTTEPVQTQPETTPSVPQVTVDNPVNFFSLSITDDTGSYLALTAYDDGAGNAYVEYMGDVKKIATMDLSVLHNITAELEKSGLVELNGADVYGDGTAYASMYISYPDESFLGANYSGTIAQEFLDGYAVMDACFQALMADVPEYVPQPVIMGEVNADGLAAMMAVLENSGLDPLDMFAISDIPTDDAYGSGLTDTTGISSITACSPMMMATAYAFTIAAVEDAGSIDAVRADFAANLEWNRWVCVSAESALIAQQGNLVVCVMASGDLYQKTADAIASTGWTNIETFENPDM